MAYLVVGTAGHIDHGKSSLVRVLSGTNPDRLKEEQKRGITIELGFAYLHLPGDNTVAIVDVPGHERFIKNMLAGVAGIDVALLIIAADEGIMPQTQEHFAILQLLEVQKIMIVITKTDLVEPEMVALLKEDIRTFLAGTTYEKAPIFAFSAVSQAGKEEILQALNEAVTEHSSSSKEEKLVRLPIDRVFTLAGFGTVVTGTLFSGRIAVGDQLYIPLKEKKVRVRNLQVHNQYVQTAEAGQRVAVNIAGVEAKEIERGDILTEEGRFMPTQRIDVSFSLLKTAAAPLRNFSRIRFHQGTSEVIGRILLWDREEISPGAKAYGQLVLEKPVVVQKEDRYVLRSYSPVTTIGGGKIIEPVACKHKKKDWEKAFEEMKLKEEGSPEKMLCLVLGQRKKPLTAPVLARQIGLGEEKVAHLLAEMTNGSNGNAGKITVLSLNEGVQAYLPTSLVKEWENALLQEAKEYLQTNPLEPGIKKAYLRSRLFNNLDLNEFNAFIKHLAGQKIISVVDGLFLAPAGVSQIQGPWLKQIQAIEKYYRDCGWQVPLWKTVVQELQLDEKTSGQILRYLTRTGDLLQLTGDLYLPKELWEEGQAKVQEWFKENPDLTLAQFRDLVGTSRKTAVPFLEYLDRMKITERSGEKRILCKKSTLEED